MNVLIGLKIGLRFKMLLALTTGKSCICGSKGFSRKLSISTSIELPLLVVQHVSVQPSAFVIKIYPSKVLEAHTLIKNDLPKD